MTGTTHFIVGAAIGRLSGNPLLAATIGFSFHFLMDMIPHWDYGYHFEKKLKNFIIAATDPLIGFLLYLIIGITSGYSYETWLNTFVGGLACLLPDIMSVFIKYFKIKSLHFLMDFHRKVHWFIKGDIDPYSWEKRFISRKELFFGILSQVPFIVLSFLVLFVK